MREDMMMEGDQEGVLGNYRGDQHILGRLGNYGLG